jgi:hypothetical protein
MVRGGVTGDTYLIMRILYFEIQFFFHSLRMKIKTWLLRFGCLLFPSWYFIYHDCICTPGKVLKLNKIFAFREGGHVDIVRLIDVLTNRGYLYCSLYFFSKNKIITVSQILKPDTYAIWRLMNDKEYDEIMFQKSSREVNKEDE